MLNTELFQNFSTVLLSSLAFYKKMVQQNTSDIWKTYKTDIIETIANEFDINTNDKELKLFVKIIDKQFKEKA